MTDVWHTPPQTPDVFKSHPIIVVYEAADQIEQMDSKEYSNLVGERYVNRWCYVDELIKENKDLSDKIGKLETELERTRKALEILQEFVMKLYLNGSITDEQLERYKKTLTLTLTLTKGGDNE